MVNKKYLALLVLFAAVVSGNAQAAIANPNAGLFGADDGSQLFNHGSIGLSIEGFDLVGATEFGFYFQGNSANLIPLFDAGDSTADIAFINFASGKVFDVDAVALQSSFTPSLSPIGFYIKLPLGTTIFTESALNLFGLDLSASFPVLNKPAYLFGFEGKLNGMTYTLAYELVAGIVPVPLPPSIAMLALAVALPLLRRAKSGGVVAPG